MKRILSYYFERELNEGIVGTDIKISIGRYVIQTGTESGTLEEDELAPLRAAVKSAADTGMLFVVYASSPLKTLRDYCGSDYIREK